MSATKALNRLAKFRTLLAGWQLGTRPKGDPECDAVSDHREATLLLRAETSALIRLLIEAGVCTHERFERVLAEEADALTDALQKRFPGVTATNDGLTFDKRALPWMKGWKP